MIRSYLLSRRVHLIFTHPPLRDAQDLFTSMRLLKLRSDGSFSLTRDLIDDIPPYAILSHTWGPDEEEVTFDDMTNQTGENKAGYNKLQFYGKQAAEDKL